ncbi:FtsK/SpoIIIE domain-containing protein [Sulfurimonas sp.]
MDYFFNLYKVESKSILEGIYINKKLDKFALEFNNFTSIDIDNYRNNKERILHYLGLIEKGYEVSIYPKRKKSVQLVFYRLPEYYEYDLLATIKRDKIFLGIFENGLLYRNFSTLDHHLIVGESGSGKSNFMQLLNINFLLNKDKIHKIYMVDLKGGVELKRYEHIPFVQFVSNIMDLDRFLESVLEDLKATQEYMLQHNIRKLDRYIMLVFDEIGAISVYPDKKLRESIFNKLALIAMQGRSSGILLFLFGQKIDNTILPANIVNNLQSRVLLKTSNDNNINIIDLKDNIRERITQTEVQDFMKGRAIYKNGLTSDKYLVQFPFVTDKLINSLIHSFP